METEPALASIVIVTWNCRTYAAECLASLDKQRISFPMEVIVVDNASSDGTPERIASQFPHVQLIRSERNLGFAKANNIGIAATRGKYLFLINPDVNVAPGCLQKMCDYMEQGPSVGLLGPKMLGPDGAVARSTMRFPTLWNSLCRALALDVLFKRSRIFGGFLMRDFQHDEVRAVDVLNGWFWMARRNAVDEVGLLDEQLFMYGDDLDWCRRFHQAHWRVVFYAPAEAVHYGGGTTANSPIPFYIALQRANLQYWAKHHGRLPMAGYFLVTFIHHLARILGYAGKYAFWRSARDDAAFKLKRSLAAIFWLTGLGPSRIDEIR
jgi:GT2 family glycosyltransferase